MELFLPRSAAESSARTPLYAVYVRAVVALHTRFEQERKEANREHETNVIAILRLQEQLIYRIRMETSIATLFTLKNCRTG